MHDFGGRELRDGADEALSALAFASEAGRGLCHLDSRDIGKGELSLVFALSAWLRSSRATIPSACSGLLELRRALLESSSLDVASEPVPLLAGDARTALLSLATYVVGLIGRAARHRTGSPAEAVEEALALLQ